MNTILKPGEYKINENESLILKTFVNITNKTEVSNYIKTNLIFLINRKDRKISNNFSYDAFIILLKRSLERELKEMQQIIDSINEIEIKSDCKYEKINDEVKEDVAKND